MKQNINLDIDNRSLTERVADKMEDLIQGGMFVSGDKLPNEYDLSKILQVGRSTMRESIKILESRHVLKIRRGFGTYVCEHVGITKDPLGLRFMNRQKKLSLDLCELRMMLEPNIARIAAENATGNDIEEIQRSCDAVALLITRHENYGKEDMLFHTKIAESTGNLVVSRVIPIICNGIESYIELTNYSRAGTAVITHQKIVDAIRMHDGAAAFLAMEQHIKENRLSLISLPDDPEPEDQ